LYLSALAILAECECLEESKDLREKELLNGYNEVISTLTNQDNTTKAYRVSVHNIAKSVILLNDKHSGLEFVEHTMHRNWRWTSDPEQDGYDPYRFSKGELKVALKEAGMTLLVKTFRLYLMETVKRFFPSSWTPDRWDAASASYRAGKSSLCSYAFIEYVSNLIALYDKISLLSPNLDEFKKVVTVAAEVGKRERAEKIELRQQQRRQELNLRASKSQTPAPTESDLSGKTVLFDPKLAPRQSFEQKQSFSQTTLDCARAPAVNPWKKRKL